jgi:hypothetical protein
MTSSQRYAFNQPHVVSESFEDEAVLINLASGNYYSTDRTGKIVIEMLAEHRSTAEIVSALAAMSNLPCPEIEPGISAFIAELQAEGLIVPAAAPPPVVASTAGKNAHSASGELDFRPPRLQRYSDMQDLLLLDPIHEVDASGWPLAKPDLPRLDE